jgi:hypothetical protein
VIGIARTGPASIYCTEILDNTYAAMTSIVSLSLRAWRNLGTVHAKVLAQSTMPCMHILVILSHTTVGSNGEVI